MSLWPRFCPFCIIWRMCLLCARHSATKPDGKRCNWWGWPGGYAANSLRSHESASCNNEPTVDVPWKALTAMISEWNDWTTSWMPSATVTACVDHVPAIRDICPLPKHLGPDLQNILRQSYDYLTIMPKLRSTYDRRVIYKTSYEGREAFLGYNSLAKS